jgi:hypothetical protein
MKGNAMWYEIKWTDAHGNTITVQRKAAMAAQYVASLFATPGCDLISMVEVPS